jgi:hypothetical protein
MHLATVDGGRLTEALRRMGGIRGGKLGTAHWTFQGKLVIDWAGMREELEADIHETLDGALAVQADAMKHITTILNYKGPTKIRWADDRLVVGMDRIPAELVAEPRSFDLPVDGNPRDLLRAMLRRPREELEQAGFAVECNEVEDKWRKSIRTAAKALAWTGIDEATVEGLVGQVLRQGQQIPAGRIPERLGEDKEYPCIVLLDDDVLFYAHEYPEPTALLLALFEELYPDEDSRERAALLLAADLPRYPGSSTVFCEFVSRRKRPSEELVRAAIDLALHQETISEFDTGLLELALKYGMTRAEEERLLAAYVTSADATPLTTNPLGHPWQNMEWWLFTFLPRMERDPMNRIRWFINKLADRLHFCPDSIQETITTAVGEWVWALGEEELLVAHELLLKGGGADPGPMNYNEIYDAVWGRRADLGVPEPEDED